MKNNDEVQLNSAMDRLESQQKNKRYPIKSVK